MTTPAEVLLEASSLDSGTPWELLNSIEGGTGGTINVVGLYNIEYLGEDGGVITYLAPTESLIVYAETDRMLVEYRRRK